MTKLSLILGLNLITETGIFCEKIYSRYKLRVLVGKYKIPMHS